MVNTTYMNSANTLLDLVLGLNTQSNEVFGPVLLLGFALIFFIVMKNKFDTSRVFLVTSFLTWILALFLWIAGVISQSVMIVPLIFLVLFVIFTGYDIFGT